MTATDDEPTACPFCVMVRDESARPMDFRWFNDCMVFTPLNPVTAGHRLVVPTLHAPDFSVAYSLLGRVMAAAGHVVSALGDFPANLIVSQGREATQTVRHMHVHVVPRRQDDGLTLPWTETGAKS